jgi:hypothetical protein
VCFAFCSYPRAAIGNKLITEAGFAPVCALIEVGNRPDKIDRLPECKHLLKAAACVNFRPNLNSTLQGIDSFYDRPLNFGVRNILAGHGCAPDLDVECGSPTLVDAQENCADLIHSTSNRFRVTGIREARNIDGVYDDLGPVGRDKFFAGQPQGFEGNKSLLLRGDPKRRSESGDNEAGYRGKTNSMSVHKATTATNISSDDGTDTAVAFLGGLFAFTAAFLTYAFLEKWR